MTDADFLQTALLIRGAQGGDRSAADELFRRYYTRIRPYVEARLGQALRADFGTSDIIQEGFMVALRKLGEFEVHGEDAFVRWMRRIVERQIIDRAKWVGADRRAHHRELRLDEVTDSDAAAWEPDSPRTGPFDAAVRGERRTRVQDAFGTLPAHYRRVIRLRLYEQLPWDGIAKLTGRPSPDAARMLFRTAMNELAKLAGRDESR